MDLDAELPTAAETTLGVRHTPPDFAVPPGACDCHVHVFGLSGCFPFAAGRLYTPGPASVTDLLAVQRALRLERAVIVQPTPYGTDNACTLDALRRLGPRARGVAVIGAATPDALRRMHEAGVRGIRVNLETHGETDPSAARDRLRAAASRAAPLGWHVQTYTNLAMLAALRDDIRALPTTLVIDHFGRASAAKGVRQPGFDALLSLLDSRKAYVKLSAAYRISSDPDHADAAEIARALIDAGPDRVLWGSDWPHPWARPGAVRDPNVVEPFRPEDDGLALNRLARWTKGPDELRRILVDNPASLYGF